MESYNGLEDPKDRRSIGWHGNQHVCVRRPQVSGTLASRLTQVDLQAWHVPEQGSCAYWCPPSKCWELGKFVVRSFVIRIVEMPGDGSCFASSSWAPRQVVAFRNGIAAVRFAGKRESSIRNSEVPRPRLRSAPMAITGS